MRAEYVEPDQAVPVIRVARSVWMRATRAVTPNPTDAGERELPGNLISALGCDGDLQGVLQNRDDLEASRGTSCASVHFGTDGLILL